MKVVREDSASLLQGFQPHYLALKCDCRRVSVVAKEAASLFANQRRRTTEAGGLNEKQAGSFAGRQGGGARIAGWHAVFCEHLATTQPADDEKRLENTDGGGCNKEEGNEVMTSD